MCGIMTINICWLYKCVMQIQSGLSSANTVHQPVQPMTHDPWPMQTTPQHTPCSVNILPKTSHIPESRPAPRMLGYTNLSFSARCRRQLSNKHSTMSRVEQKWPQHTALFCYGATLFWNKKWHCHVHNSPLPDPNPRQLNAISTENNRSTIHVFTSGMP